MTRLELNEHTFDVACKEAGYWAKKRCLKKMQKVLYRTEYKYDSRKNVYYPALLTRPPADAEAYVERFVSFYYHRAAAKGAV